MNEARAASLILAEQAPDQRLRIFTALLTSESGLGTDGLMVVGGSAIEIYTGGSYVSGDVDYVTDSRRSIANVLQGWKFRDEGKWFSKREWSLFVDIMETRGTGSRRLTRVITTKVGPFRIAAIEDLLIKRVREAVNWQDRQEAFDQAVLLARHADTVDWEYIRFYATKEEWLTQYEQLRRESRMQRPSKKPT
jgi:hypothetical protein